MKLYSCLFAFLLSTVGNPLPAIDNNAQLDFTELDSPPFAGHYDSQLPPSEEQSSRVQVDTNSNMNPLLFSVASENPDSQIEHFSQTSNVEKSNSGPDGGVCDDEPESGSGSQNINKYRIRRDGPMCAVKEEDIDWDKLWATFSRSRQAAGGEAPACTDPHYPLHLCCRGPRSLYVYNRIIAREVKNCSPCKLSFILFVPCRYSGIVNIYTLIDLMLCVLPYHNVCCQSYEVSLIFLAESVFMNMPSRRKCWRRLQQPLSANSPGYECISADSIWELKNKTMIQKRDGKGYWKEWLRGNEDDIRFAEGLPGREQAEVDTLLEPRICLEELASFRNSAPPHKDSADSMALESAAYSACVLELSIPDSLA